jgi:hypothetical protein
MDVDIIIDTNEENEEIEKLNSDKLLVVCHKNLPHPFHLTWKHRIHMAELIEEYDYFMYLEHDMLVPYENLIEYTKNFEILYPQGFVPSFIRIEEYNNKKYVVDLLEPQIDLFSVKIDENIFANLKQPYHAFWIMPKKELQESISNTFYDINAINRELAASFPMWQLNKKPVVLLDGNKISSKCYSYHTSNNYSEDLNSPHGKIELENLIITLKDYEIKITENKIENKYEINCKIPSDINEHLPTLFEYAKKCNHVTEMGVRWVSSSWAFFKANPGKIVSIDIVKDKNVQDLIDVSREYNINFEFIEADVLKFEIEETDLLFIDTWHTYRQLSKELELHSKKVRKYIIFHDTISYAIIDEGNYESVSELALELPNKKQGLVPAINDFLSSELGKEWEIERIYSNNNGLTILKNNKIKNPDDDKKLMIDYYKRILTKTIYNDGVYEEWVKTKQFPPKYIMDYVLRIPVKDEDVEKLTYLDKLENKISSGTFSFEEKFSFEENSIDSDFIGMYENIMK